MAAVLFGASAPFAKVLLRGAAPQMLAGLLYLGSGGGLGPVLLMAGLAGTPASSASLLLNLEAVLTALLLGFLSYGVSLVLFVVALRYLGTARTGAYVSVAPFVGAAVSLGVFRERPTAFLVIGGRSWRSVCCFTSPSGTNTSTRTRPWIMVTHTCTTSITSTSTTCRTRR
jgi:drug/metabolite transporter (DMT)-like permease